MAKRDETPLTEEQRAMAAQFMPLAWKLARRWKRRYGVDLDEAISEASSALCFAARRFDAGRGIKFMTFAFNRIVMGLRALTSRNATRPRPARFPEHANELYGAPVPEESDIAVDDMDRYLALLSDRQEAIVMARFIDGMTLEQAGKLFGLTKERVRQIEIKALEIMQIACDEDREAVA